MDVDAVLLDIGGWGRYQKALFVFTTFPLLFVGAEFASHSWTGYEIGHRCLIRGCERVSNATYNASFLQHSTPTEKVIKDKSIPWSKCYRYKRIHPTSCGKGAFNKSVKLPCNNWVFDTSVLNISTVSEFGLYCKRAYLNPMSESIFMAGMLVGSIVIGDTCDRIGRKLGVLTTLLMFGLSSFATALSPNYVVLAIFRFCTGASGIGAINAIFVYVVEMVHSKVRSQCGIAVSVVGSSGMLLFGALPIYIKTWRTLQLCVSIPVLIYVPCALWIPESPRWLSATGRYKKAEAVLRRAAACNRRPYPNAMPLKPSSMRLLEALTPYSRVDVSIPKRPSAQVLIDTLVPHVAGSSVRELASLPRGQCDSSLQVRAPLWLRDSVASVPAKATLLDLLRFPTLRYRTMITLFQWFTVAMVYYGLVLSANRLPGNVFFDFILMALMDIPCMLSIMMFVGSVGNKLSCFLLFALTGVGGLVSGFASQATGQQTLGLVFALIGKFGAAGCFAIMNNYSSELFPTDIRNSALGLASGSGRIGSFLSPFIVQYAQSSSLLFSMGIFSLSSFIAAGITLALPETSKQNLPRSINEAESFGNKQGICHIPCLTEESQDQSSGHHSAVSSASSHGRWLAPSQEMEPPSMHMRTITFDDDFSVGMPG